MNNWSVITNDLLNLKGMSFITAWNYLHNYTSVVLITDGNTVFHKDDKITVFEYLKYTLLDWII